MGFMDLKVKSSKLLCKKFGVDFSDLKKKDFYCDNDPTTEALEALAEYLNEKCPEITFEDLIEICDEELNMNVSNASMLIDFLKNNNIQYEREYDVNEPCEDFNSDDPENISVNLKQLLDIIK